MGKGNIFSSFERTAQIPPLFAMIKFTALQRSSSDTPTAIILCESCPTELAIAPSLIPKFLINAIDGLLFL